MKKSPYNLSHALQEKPEILIKQAEKTPVEESYPHPFSEKSMNFTYPQNLWISYPHYPQGK